MTLKPVHMPKQSKELTTTIRLSLATRAALERLKEKRAAVCGRWPNTRELVTEALTAYLKRAGVVQEVKP